MTQNSDTSGYKWSVPIPNTETSNSTPIHRSSYPDASPSLGCCGCQTLYEALRHGQSINPLGPCLGFRAVSAHTGFATPFVYSSYTEVVARVESIAAGLNDMGLVKRNEDGMLLLGIYMRNCMEWVLAEHAIFTLGGATVPLYDTLGPDTVSFVLGQTNLSTCVCSRAELPCLVEAKKSGDFPNFQCIILIDGVTPEATQQCNEVNLQVISLSTIETHGVRIQDVNPAYQFHSPPSADDIATFCYTSGTTGDPKGALLTHMNFLTTMDAVSKVLTPDITDRHMSYLPLPHIFERLSLSATLVFGGSVGFFRGDTTLLIEDLVACRPTTLPAAPRVLNKIYDKIMAGINNAGGMKKKIFFAALAAKADGLQRGKLTHGLYDAILFNKIKKALGLDCVRILVSGSAPLSAHVMTFFRCMLGVPVVEGYGQTEGTAAATIGSVDDMSSVGHVGGPLSCVEICLVDVPDMNYLSSDTVHEGKRCRGRGEICIRGPSVFKGYYKNEEKTKETVDENGWLHSGDVGLWTMEGAVQIIDRKKNIFKLAQGEYVAVEKIENILTQSAFIAQPFVYGDSFQSTLVAIIVPDEDVLKNWATTSGLTSIDTKELCKSKALNAEILKDMKRLAKESGLHGFETPKAIYLEHEPFTVESGLVTPTFKLKRQQLRDHYKTQIDDMYTNMPPPPSKL
mmetsp:Transcript_4213/g.4818  ORF Transcript_4213/g.4818 Transcript_4213/m.4818 type:complete len:682 (-) Transcript_4213:145-2190(-)|eukprot:CAMPEP_0198257208 /NCGR_PEP_ID=MMETSP1447-20131203/6925_1 /TAXON_ID=420782 /ORGANISM="Chaetoceros dichaeta, Strain CCMP1751" /LENGTH=681 /DNA_ID=CAMNT_0043944043 /DNA_START=20 /DNA_END=2065 /DNA_ORIENTATION=+